MIELEHSITVNSPADRVFDFLSSVNNLPLYLPTLREATPLPGERVRLEGDLGENQPYRVEGRFRVHPDSHRLEWGSDDQHYGGELTVRGSSLNSVVRIQLRFERAPAGMGDDAGEILHRVLVETLESIQNVVERKGRTVRPGEFES